MLLQPGVDPLRSYPNRTAPAQARTPKLVALARGVDRVPAHAGVVRSLRDIEPGLHHRNLPTRARVPTRTLELCVLRSCARGARPDSGAPETERGDEGLRPTSGTEGLSPTVTRSDNRESTHHSTGTLRWACCPHEHQRAVSA